ncbi:hypothetical protein B0I35DRAFT_474343 [Stachybotrys elegans]|uniref:Carrier domain-containing protein n=1 Tax=Stachybotrys elegans TaxID=80388 RepID=A0A8K0SYK6_9HYPO|nr:hypothetical protein B0I35DRAFT_474343 [Stachybotrys elegans]
MSEQSPTAATLADHYSVLETFPPPPGKDDLWELQTHVLSEKHNILSQSTEGYLSSSDSVSSVSATSEALERIWQWNSKVPETLERCVHHLFEEMVEAQPNAPAICAWNGSLTYTQLNALAAKLACSLRGLGVRPDLLIPLCFEKSVWTSVAIMGVLKAGGAFVLLDPALPEHRLRSIIEETKAGLILSSSLNRDLSSKLSRNVVIVDSDLQMDHSEASGVQQASQDMSPKSLVYAIFTSGSTGVPKGVEMDHRNFASAIHHQKDTLNLDSTSRVLDVSSYSYSTSISNVLMTLAVGGCLCVPSEGDIRDNLQQSVEILKANTIFLTPTVAQFLSPEQLPSLRTVVFVGEPLRVKDVKRWWGNVRVLNRYGASECAASITVNANPSCVDDAILIGKGLGSVTWVVDPEDHNTLLAPGCVGELVLEGPTICRGYLNDTTRTESSMLQDPDWLLEGSKDQPGRRGRLFKTGDLVRYTEDGKLSHVGRKDTMVKIRGQRVELGEIECRVQECMPEVYQVVAEVIVPVGDSTSPVVAVFAQLESTTGQTSNGTVSGVPAPRPVPDTVAAQLAQFLPRHMLPKLLLYMDKIPQTSTGKTDRKTLRELGNQLTAQELAELQTGPSECKQSPRSEVEAEMQVIWSKVLGLEVSTIGVEDSFFHLGGDSIAAMKVVAEARRRGLHLAVADMLRFSKLSEVASRSGINTAGFEIPRAPHRGFCEQSFPQQSLWFIHQAAPEQATYLMARAVRIHGALQLGALEAALNALESRHETLRTTFETANGQNVQHVRPFQERKLGVADVASEQVLSLNLQRDHTTAFDLTKEPGWRVKVYRLGDQLHVLSIVMHHIISDGWSIDVIRKELDLFYSAAIKGEDPLAHVRPLSIQYSDYAAFQRQKDQSGETLRQLEYWTTQLTGSRPATFPCDRPRGASLTGRAASQEYTITGNLYHRLQSFCKSRNLTPFIALLSAFRATHFRLTGANDATIGTVNANRDNWQLRDMIGFFAIVNCIRTQVERHSFEELLSQAREAVIGAFENKDVPFEKIVSKLSPNRDLSRHPLVQVGFGFHPQSDLKSFTLEGLETESIAVSDLTRFDLEFHFYQEEGSLRAKLVYSTELYEAQRISNILATFDQVLHQSLSHPDEPIESLSLMTERDFTVLDSMGLTRIHQTDYPRESSIVDVFLQQVAAHPQRVAVKDSTTQLTYSELYESSLTVSRWLRARELEPETLVGVIASRSCHTIVAFLGILMANLAYLPINSTTPTSRIETVLSSTPGHKITLLGPGVVPPTMKSLSVEFIGILDVLREQSTISDAPTASPSASSLAYVMFTSGSTGRPKGVMIENRGILRMVRQNDMINCLPESTVMAHIANIDFDMSTTEIYGALLNGGTLICVEAAEVADPMLMADVLLREKVDALIITPALLRQYLRYCPDALSQIEALFVGGDRSQVEDFLKAQEIIKGTICHGYGPTENSGVSTVYCLPAGGVYPTSVPIGRALSNSGAYVMDVNQHLVPLGVIGELVVTGDGLARGYLDPQQNENRFISVQIGDEKVRAYRTGDRVCYRPSDGQLEFLDRLDGQVKIRGQRVEVGEIENAIRRHARVDEAVAVFQSDDRGDRISAFFTVGWDNSGARETSPGSIQSNQDAKADILRSVMDMLSSNLASYMVPQLTMVDKIPVTENGKVDRKALMVYEVAEAPERRKEPPVSSEEQLVADVWASVLRIERDTIDRHDNFFQLGGNSIAAMGVASELRNKGLKVQVADVFRFPKLTDLATNGGLLLEETEQPTIAPFALLGDDVDVPEFIHEVTHDYDSFKNITDAYPCTALQEGLMSLTLRSPGDYITQNVLELGPEVTEQALRAAWEHVVRETPILRTRIIQHRQLGIVQVILDEEAPWTHASGELRQHLQADKETSMGLGDPLCRFTFVNNDSEGRRWLILTIHHALYDGFSWPRVLEAVYRAYRMDPMEPETPFQLFIQHARTQAQSEEASAYWNQTLEGFKGLPYPTLPPSVPHPRADSVVEYDFTHAKTLKNSQFTSSTFIRAGWALVVGHMTGMDDIAYGVTVSGRNATIDRPESVMGPTIATLPIRFNLTLTITVPDLLEAVQKQAVDMIPFEQVGLQKISKLSAAARDACMFQTLLVVQPEHDMNQECILGKWQDPQHSWSNTYALTLKIFLRDAGISARAEFDSRVVEPWLVRNLLSRLDFALHCLDSAEPQQRLSDIDILTPRDLETIWSTNHSCPLPLELTIDSMISEHVHSRPKLDELATLLAAALIDHGVGPEFLVPICLEKSMWVVVSILGVIKAGGGFVLLDPSLPEHRLQTIVEQVNDGAVILSSVLTQELCQRLAKKNITIGPTFFSALHEEPSLQLPPIEPSSTLYVVFTSGSTGTPKGVVISHTNAASAICHQADEMDATTESRVLDFASYAFDASISNILTALTMGGCLCIPSEEDRVNNLEGAIISLQANKLDITPSVAETLDPERITPTVRTIIFGGESLRAMDLEKWWGKVHIIHVYGPCECTPTSTINGTSSSPEQALRMGKGKGLLTWVVDPEDHDSLVPPGCVGELLLEGPLVGRGYLHDAKKTEASFIRDPVWLVRGTPERPGRQGRLYKTGDLVRCEPDGNLTFIARKDAQVKIRGQRIELGDVEHWLKVCVPGALSATAEMIRPQGGSGEEVMAGFLQIREEVPQSPRILPATAEVEDRLAKHLPVYMIPKVLVVLSELPMTKTGKKDRKQLREIGSRFSVEDLAGSQTASQTSKRPPTSSVELSMQKLWAQVLNLEDSKIGLDDSFFQLGGDSIKAMMLVVEARKVGLRLEVADIFRSPRLESLAHHSAQQHAESTGDVAAFALIEPTPDLPSVLQMLCSQMNVSQDDICDIYPCTALQEGLMSLTSRRSGDYIAQVILDIEPTVSIDGLCSALQQVSDATPILRTRITQSSGLGLVQVVLKEGISWRRAVGLNDYLAADREVPMELGQRLTRYALVSEAEGHEPKWLIWTLHHALYDGWSMSRIMASIYDAYQGQPVKPAPQYQRFIEYIKSRDETEVRDYWQRTLIDSEFVQFPSVSPSLGQPVADGTVARSYPCPDSNQLGITKSMLLRAAWALVAAHMTNSKDVVFGATVSGRNAPVDGLDGMLGPTIATMPIRIQLNDDQTIGEYLHAVQQEATEMIPFEQTGLHKIAEFSPLLQKACDFQTLLVIQPQGKDSHASPLGEWRSGSREHVFNTYALTIEVHLESDAITISVMHDSRVLQPWVAHGLLERLHYVFQQLNQLPASSPVADVQILTTQDLDRIWNWNSVVPATIPRLVRDVIEDNVRDRPTAPAVCAWDGQLTYKELDRLSAQVARSLISYGVGPDVFVPLCFEKSMWTTVAILGVMKAGGAFVLLDPSLPEQRLQVVVNQLKVEVIMSSDTHAEMSSRLARQAVVLDWTFFDTTLVGAQNDNLPDTQKPTPDSLLYAVFTSGSTGLPKGVLISNANASSALHHQAKHMGISQDSRIYDFASYSFDVSVSNVLTALSAGGCLCVPSDQDRKDNLEQSIASLEATVLDITPSVAQVLSPDRLPAVKTLIFGGEALHLRDVKRWWGRVQIIHIYGPCECTPTSTINYQSASDPDEAVSIGKGVGLLTWVVDPDDHDVLLAPGCTGELLLEGPLVGQGYLDDAAKTAAAFIENPAWLVRGSENHPGRQGRVYKSGDLVRYTEDGNLTFVGRKEKSQVKIRGQRLELAEIEHSIRKHSQVDEAVVLVQQKKEQEPRIVSFVTVRHEDKVAVVEQGDSTESQYTDQWKFRFDSEYAPITDITLESFGRDFMGWTSMYDGSDIPIPEMNEWLDATIETILDGGISGHVLEIGTGSGMMLFNLAKGLNYYIGLEPSRNAVDFINQTTRSIRSLHNKVTMFEASAADITRLGDRLFASRVVVNSVAQYFPSEDYLFRAIQDLLQVPGPGEKTMFFGDIRSHPLHREFLVRRALHITGDNPELQQLRRIVDDLESAESELLIDPGFFTSLPDRLPNLVSHVEVLPKQMHATNELSSYRYDAVIYARGNVEEQRQQVKDVDDEEWIDFKEQQLDRQSLVELVSRPTESTVVLAVCNIPCGKILLERHIVDILDRDEPEAHTGQDWLAEARQATERLPCIAAVDLVDIAKEAGCRVEISWARQYSQHGAMDAIFHRYEPEQGRSRTQFRFPTDHQDRLRGPLTNQPLKQQKHAEIREELFTMLKSQLPIYMIPQTIQILDSMPLNRNGKIDRQYLLQNIPDELAIRGSARQPTTESQLRMQQVWAEVLNIELSQIGLDDSFFHLGGSSIAAMKVVAEIRKLGMNLTVADVFRYPVLHQLADKIDDEPKAEELESPIAPFSLLDGALDVESVTQRLNAQQSLAGTSRPATVLDAYPCTPLQECLIDTTFKSPGSFVAQYILELAPHISAERLQAAWEQVVRCFPILRTRLFRDEDLGMLQVVVDEGVTWTEAEDLTAYLESDIQQPMGMSEPLARYALVKDQSASPKWLVWTIHHVLYDGWSLPLILDAVRKAYRGESIHQGPPFTSFIKYIKDQDTAMTREYWLQNLDDCHCLPYPSLPPHIEQPITNNSIERCIPQPQHNHTGITPPIMMRAAWALLVGHMTNTTDVVFGVTVSGRTAPIADIEMVAGPTFARAPVRIRWDKMGTVGEYLHAVQAQATEMMTYEQAGLTRIAELSAGARQACMFQTHLVVQPADMDGEAEELGQWKNKLGLGRQFSSYALKLTVQMGQTEAKIVADFDERVMQPSLVERLLKRLGHVVSQLDKANPESSLSEIGSLTTDGLEQT